MNDAGSTRHGVGVVGSLQVQHIMGGVWQTPYRVNTSWGGVIVPLQGQHVIWGGGIAPLVLSFEQCFILFCRFPLLFVFVVGGLGFEFCVFVAGWRHALRSEWPFIIIIIIAPLQGQHV